jgi:phage replication-related protein YjqB (UPF0714/DUF867 family)
MPFADFSTLVLHTLKGKDWELVVRQPGAPVTIITIHGGDIEPLTSELAAAIAGDEHNLYDLRGLRAQDNAELRVPPIHFQEMRLQMLLDRCQTALHLDGIPGDDPVVILGGGNVTLVGHLEAALRAAGFCVEPPPSPLMVQSRQRFYNQSELAGTQMELTLGLRRQMFTVPPAEGSDWRNIGHPTLVLETFVEAVRRALQDYLVAMRSDLGLTMQRFEQATKDFPTHLRSHNGQHHHQDKPEKGTD